MINKKYKDRIFRLVFNDNGSLLELYNALNNSHYDDPQLLEITTLEDAVYMSMKNDLSFLIDDVLNLYGSRLCTLPAPNYVVFYNGTKAAPDRSLLKLSDAFPAEMVYGPVWSWRL